MDAPKPLIACTGMYVIPLMAFGAVLNVEDLPL